MCPRGVQLGLVEGPPDVNRVQQGPASRSAVKGAVHVTRPRKLQLKLGQTFGEGDLHRICAADGSLKPSSRWATALGAGGSGSVYACVYGQYKQRRAVKFLTLNKLDDERTGRRREDFEATFELERAVLSQLSHSNISIFHEDGIYVDQNADVWPYIVTDHVAGPMLFDALGEPGIRGEDVYKILSDLFDAVAYLHRHGIYHCDIKLDNIRMRDVGHMQALDVVLLDWGAAQAFKTAAAPAAQATLDVTLDHEAPRQFISTKDITHEAHRHHLGRRLVTTELAAFVPRHELHTLGVLIEDILDVPAHEYRVKRELGRTLGDQGLRVLEEMVVDLKSAPLGLGYESVEELVADFAKLHRNYLSPAGVAELSLAGEYQTSVPTATGRAVLTRRFSRLTGHRLVNRLHQVHQLESTYETFPGATHTRFSHSVAVLRNVRYYVSHLLNDSRFRRQAERVDLEATLLLALLHDIGHFQLSHMFEDLASDQRRGTSDWSTIDFDIPTDDTLFQEVLGVPNGSQLRGGYHERIHARAEELHLASLSALDTDRYATPWEVIVAEFSEDTAAALVRLHNVIYASPKPEDSSPSQRALAALLSSDIDADKTAYLVEDSKRTGVAYGLGVELDGLLGNLCMPTAEDFQRAHPNPVIGIRRAGVQAAQSVAVSRNQMLSQVYWHSNNRAITAMVKYPIMRLLRANALDLPEYLTFAMFSSRQTCLEYLANVFDLVRMEDEVNPINGVIAGGRTLYQRVCEIRQGLVDDASELNEKLLTRSYLQILDIQERLRTELSRDHRFRGLGVGEVLLDIPSKERAKPSGERGGRVFVYRRGQTVGQGYPLDTEAPLYDGLKHQHREVNRVSRVFLAPYWAQRIAAGEVEDVATQIVRRLWQEVS